MFKFCVLFNQLEIGHYLSKKNGLRTVHDSVICGPVNGTETVHYGVCAITLKSPFFKY